MFKCRGTFASSSWEDQIWESANQRTGNIGSQCPSNVKVQTLKVPLKSEAMRTRSQQRMRLNERALSSKILAFTNEELTSGIGEERKTLSCRHRGRLRRLFAYADLQLRPDSGADEWNELIRTALWRSLLVVIHTYATGSVPLTLFVWI